MSPTNKNKDDVLIRESESDYYLKDNATSVWITVGDISVYVMRTDEGVVVDLYPLDNENDESLASTYAFFSEVTDEEED